MNYQVIKPFIDLEDGNHQYLEGDKYPRKENPKKDRIKALMSEENRANEIMIKEVRSE